MYYSDGLFNADTFVVQAEDSLILLVNSDEMDRHTIKTSLQLHWDVISASSSKEAFSIMSKGIIPTLIVLSYELDGESGIKVMHRLLNSAKYKHIPVLFTSLSYSQAYEEECLLIGAADFIARPFTPDILIQRVDKAMYYSQMESFLKEDVFKSTIPGTKGPRQYKGFMYQMLTSLSSTIDAKDAYTKGHSSRVASYSALMGKSMGLSSEEVDILFHSGLLHDIGKIGISDAIIRKRNSLTAAEFKIIREHPVTGFNILKDIHIMPELSQVARWHHERFDGGGYPDNLSGDDIPLLARIVSVADSFDAMTSTRAYRKAVRSSDAAAELKACRGTQFDPYLTDLAIDLIDKGLLKGTVDDELDNEYSA